jgi:GTP cyclohydrolase II
MMIRLAERELKTKFGTFTEMLYYDGRSESIALVMGDVANAEDVFCRIHSHCIGAHIFNSIECDCREQMASAQEMIQKEGRGVIIWLDQEGKGNGHLALMQSIPFKKAGDSQADAYVKAGFRADARDYRAAAEILSELKVRSIVLLANGGGKADELRRDSVNVSGVKALNVQSS